MLGGKLLTGAPLDVLGECPHRFLGDFDSVTAINRGFRDVDGSKYFDAAALALNPKRHCGLYGIFGPLKAAARDGLLDKILLLGGEVYLHNVVRSRPGLEIKGVNDFNVVDVVDCDRDESRPPPAGRFARKNAS
jgi:hypothetical protein